MSGKAASRLALAAGAALTILYLALWAQLPIQALAGAGLDDGLYVKLAARIAAGQWLGPYGLATLARGPVYPAWIALNYFLGSPLLLGQGVLYVLGALFAVAALGRRSWPRIALVSIFLFILFNPFNVCGAGLRVLREGLYVPLTLFIIGGAAWTLRLRSSPFRTRAVFAAAFGLLIGVYWLTQEEGVWIIPAIGLTVFLNAAGAFRSRAGRKRALLIETALVAVTVAFAALPSAFVAAMNRESYDVWETVDLKQTDFLRAYGALSRIKAGSRVRYVPVSLEVLKTAA